MMGRMFGFIMSCKPVQHFLADLSSMRAIWNWIVLVLFVWAAIYMILTNPMVHGTVITVLGGVAAAIFTNYVFSTTWERVKGIRGPEMPTGGDKPPASEEGAAD